MRIDRKLFETEAKLQPEISSIELAQACGTGSTLFRFIGKILREHAEFENSLVRMDLISEEGRMLALRQQGLVQGRAMLIEAMIDLIIDGTGEEVNGNAEPEFELIPNRERVAAE